MAFNGSGTFVINSAGQPVVAGTTITDTAFNALTADLATGLSLCMTKDGQQTAAANIPMGGYKLTGLGLGSSTTDSARMDNAVHPGVMEGRLCSDTPNSGGTIRQADPFSTVYLCPYVGNKISLYNGTQWVLRSITTSSTNVGFPGGSTNTNYDVFAYDNAGTVTLELVAWASDTARSTGLVFQDGVLVKSGTTTKRYLGTARTGTSAGFGNDSETKRFIWNYYNRIPLTMKATETGTWNYTTATFRQANANTANQLDFVVGLNDTIVQANVLTSFRNSSAAVVARVGIGLSSTTTNSATLAPTFVSQVANIQNAAQAVYNGLPGIGRRYLVWLEYSVASGTCTWNDTAEGGIYAVLWG